MSSIKTTSFISEGLELKGHLKLEGGIRVDGRIEGSIESKSTIYLGESAVIHGDLVTENLVSSGQILGEVTAFDEVRIKRPGILKGNVKAQSMVIDKEVYFDGKCTLSHPEAIEAPALEEPNDPRPALPERNGKAKKKKDGGR